MEKYFKELPKDYELKKKLCSKNKKVLFFSFVIAVITLSYYFYVFRNQIDILSANLSDWIIIGILLILILFSHELLHAVPMYKINKDVKLNMNFISITPNVKSNGYFSKNSSIIIALFPLVIQSPILFILIIILKEYNHLLIFLLIVAVLSCIADIYAVHVLLKYPKDTLIEDLGETLFIYTKNAELK